MAWCCISVGSLCHIADNDNQQRRIAGQLREAIRTATRAVEGAVRFQNTLAGSEPDAIEFVIGVGGLGFVPLALVDADHAPGVAGDAAVGEEIGWIGEDEVDGGLGDEGKEFEAIALVEADVVFFVVVDGSGEFDGGFGHGEVIDLDR